MTQHSGWYLSSSSEPSWKRLQAWQSRTNLVPQKATSRQFHFLCNADIPKDDLQGGALPPPKAGLKHFLGKLKGRSKSVDLTNIPTDAFSDRRASVGSVVPTRPVETTRQNDGMGVQSDWTGVTIHANLNITFRPKKGGAVRTCVSNMPLHDYFDLLISELGKPEKSANVHLHPNSQSRYDSASWQTPTLDWPQENPQKLTHIDPSLPQNYRLSIGFVTRPFPPFLLPGTYATSVALCFAPYEGLSIQWTDYKGHTKTEYLSWKLHPGLTLRVGDVVRSHYNPTTHHVSFELNGEPLKFSAKVENMWGKDMQLFPAIGCNHGAQVLCSIGQDLEEVFDWSPLYGDDASSSASSVSDVSVDYHVPAWMEKCG
jgi:hypothetical protein